MRTEGKVSKVAICEKCNAMILGCHVDHISKKTEKEFTELTNEGFVVKLETIPETQARKWGTYGECVNSTCKA